MILGIVGHAAEKFTKETELLAKLKIHRLIKTFEPEMIVSGRSPMGGVDIWAEYAADKHGIPTEIFAPTSHRWDGPGGFKERNLQIAEKADLVACIVVADFPRDFQGKRFPYCYHCKDRNPPHVKSGGCWTAWRAKKGLWIILSETDPDA